MRRKPTAIDLFSGAGGLTEGLKQAGFAVLGAVEIDALACQTYRLNHKGVKLWEKDVRRVTGSGLMADLGLDSGELDLLAACPPCQGFSVIRTKNGNRRNRDKRNDLIFDVLRIVRSIRPKSVMLENVPRLIESQRFRVFRRGLKSLGYQVTWGVLDAVEFAVPQRRRRLVLLASKLMKPVFAKRANSYRTVRQSIGNLASPRRSRDRLHNYKVRRSAGVQDLIRAIPKNGGSRLALGADRQLTCHKESDGFHDVYGRMAWNRPSPTITGGCINPSKGRFLHPQANRAITLREAALLQTFPKSYRFPLDENRDNLALLIGNALPPEFIRRQALTLKEVCLSQSK